MAKAECIEGFSPITLTVETEEEARYLWYALNMSPADIQKQHNQKLDALHGDHLWSTFDKVYRPKERKR